MEPLWSPVVATGGKRWQIAQPRNGSQEGVNLERGPTVFDAPQPLGREARVEREVEVGVGAAVDQGWARTRRISRVAHRTHAMRAGACRPGLGALRLGSAQGFPITFRSFPAPVTACRTRRGGGSTPGTRRPRRGLSLPGREW